MKAFPDCLPCQVTAALKTLRKATNDETVVSKVMIEVLHILSDYGYGVPPPRVFREIMRRIKAETGNPDPYSRDKEEQNKRALSLYEDLKGKVKGAEDPFHEVLLISSGGNLIDAVIEDRVSGGLGSLGSFLIDDYPDLRKELRRASRLLIVGDNAGEVITDRLMIEEIRQRWEGEIVYAVRGAPTLNDVTLGDIQGLGLEELCSILSTGDDTPGVVLELCSEEFREAFEAADVIIAKGQGNFETLEELKDPRIFFLLWAKCEPIVRYLGLDRSGPVLLRSRP
ncbi:MAG: hypothetical protein DRG31_07565 [Deltaproteobacteria bacterium]|nr:MAG: hypothetical protein DRG31_07565 [Deltaproteobacteria bacterium]